MVVFDESLSWILRQSLKLGPVGRLFDFLTLPELLKLSSVSRRNRALAPVPRLANGPLRRHFAVYSA